MSQLIQSFYREVQTICRAENETQLVSYLSNDGLVLLKQLLLTEIHVSETDDIHAVMLSSSSPRSTQLSAVTWAYFSSN
jgi:hypothetical protein